LFEMTAILGHILYDQCPFHMMNRDYLGNMTVILLIRQFSRGIFLILWYDSKKYTHQNSQITELCVSFKF